jgi:hypothetical protein
MRHYCTYFDQNFLPFGLALHESLKRHESDFVLHTLCLDEPTFQFLSNLKLNTLIPLRLEELERFDPALLSVKPSRSKVEYYFTLTPCLCRFLLSTIGFEQTLFYVDADLFFYKDPGPAYAELGDGSILIVGHRFPHHYKDLEVYGIYNVGLIAFRNTEEGRECVSWWRDQCLDWCYDRLEPGRFADQKYLDYWPTLFPATRVLGHKGAGLGPWNVARYRIRSGHDVLVDEDKLVFYHFHNLRQVSSHLWDAGQFPLTRDVCRHVYWPYIRTLQRLCKQHGLPCRVRRRADVSWTQLHRTILQHIYLICIGPLCYHVDLTRFGPRLSRLRRFLLSQPVQ